MDKAKFAELKRKIRAHPAFRGGSADETYWLDFMEATLSLHPDGYDTTAEIMAGAALKRPEIWPGYVEASRDDLLFWKVVQELVRLVRSGVLEGHNVSVEALECLNEWALDVATGERIEPPDRSDTRKLMMRDATIVVTVNGIREVSGIPYEFDEPRSGKPRSACHVVAHRLGWEYTTVRSIWRKGRPLLKRAQEHGLVPPSRKRTRRPQTP